LQLVAQGTEQGMAVNANLAPWRQLILIRNENSSSPESEG
jgi:hypothetical protein